MKLINKFLDYYFNKLNPTILGVPNNTIYEITKLVFEIETELNSSKTSADLSETIKTINVIVKNINKWIKPYSEININRVVQRTLKINQLLNYFSDGKITTLSQVEIILNDYRKALK